MCHSLFLGRYPDIDNFSECSAFGKPSVGPRPSAQGISNVVWAYARLDLLHLPLLSAVAKHLLNTDLLVSFNPQNLANTAWGYVWVSHY
jgi:hypothetical protein